MRCSVTRRWCGSCTRRSRGVKRVAIPNANTKSAERKKLRKKRWFRNAQKWRTGSEDRISLLKRRHGLGVPSTSPGRAVARGSARSSRVCDPGQSGFDGLADLLGEIPCILAHRCNRLADDHANRARLLQDPASRPKSAGIVRERYDEFAAGDRQKRTAHAELASLARHHARALGK